MKYQLINSVEEGRYERTFHTDFSCAKHLHRYLEVAYVLEGELQVVLNGREYLLKAGEMALVFPHKVHEYTTLTHNKVAVFVISRDLIPFITSIFETNEADTYVFRPNDAVRSYFDHAILGEDNPNLLLIRAAFYAVVNDFTTINELRLKKDANNDLIQKVLTYIEANYQNQITLRSTADILGYSPGYISHALNETLGMGFRQFLNYYRVDQARFLLRDKDMDITTVAMECGFQSLRNFNRVFLQSTGVQPQKYRKHTKE